MTMRRIGICITARKVRHGNSHHRLGTTDAMNLLHSSNYIGHVFNHVVGVDFAKVIVRKGPGTHVEVMCDVGTGCCRDVEVDCPGKVLAATSQVQDVTLQQFGDLAWFHSGLIVGATTKTKNPPRRHGGGEDQMLTAEGAEKRRGAQREFDFG